MFYLINEYVTDHVCSIFRHGHNYKQMNKTLFVIVLSFVTLATINCQEEDFFSSGNKESEKKDRKLENWSFGGNLGLSFGSYNSYVEVSPVAMYKASPRFSVGPGFTYLYINRYKGTPYNFKYSIYGPRAIANYTLFKDLDELININIGNIILQSEYEFLNTTDWLVASNGYYIENGRRWVNNFLVGGGIFQPFGNKGGISLVVLYNLIPNDFPIYTNPVVRFGIYF